MANEIQVTSQLTYTNAAQGIVAKTLALLGSFFSITGAAYELLDWVVPTTAGGTAIPIAPLASLGWHLIINRDATNYNQILTAVSGTAYHHLQPGECSMGRWDTGITAPAMLAHTATTRIEGLILEN